MDSTESAAIAATLNNQDLVNRVTAVAGREVGDPLNNPHDSVELRYQFNLTVEHASKTVFAFNDDGVCAAVPIGEVFGVPHAARRATCVAVASMWKPATNFKLGDTT